MLSSRQWQLYNLLKTQPYHWFTQREICDAVHEYHYIDDDRNNCVEIGSDRIIINADSQTDKIIVTKKHCFKIATLEEYRKERASHIARIKSQVAQVEAMDRKFERNGQGKIFNNVLNDLKSENEQFHQTFMEGIFALYSDVKKTVWIIRCDKVVRADAKTVTIYGGKYNMQKVGCDMFDEISSLDKVRSGYRVIDLTKEK